MCSDAQSCLTLLPPHGLQPTRLLCPWDFPGKDTGAGSHFLLQWIFLTQGSNPCLYVSCIGRWILYQQHHLGSPGKAMLSLKVLGDSLFHPFVLASSVHTILVILQFLDTSFQSLPPSSNGILSVCTSSSSKDTSCTKCRVHDLVSKQGHTLGVSLWL